MQPIAYLFMPGNARTAFTRYGEIFGASPDVMPVGEMVPGENPDATMHAALKIGEGWLYGADDFSGEGAKMEGVSISISLDTKEETERVWAALADGGEVKSKLEPVFFTPLFGTLKDAFGVRWMIQQTA